jgi:DNA-binding NarL/FixJ family response regulator
VDDHPTMLEYVLRVLETDFLVVGTACNTEALVTALPTARPDAIVLDVSLGSDSGFDAAHRARSFGCLAPIVFLSVHEAPEIVHAAWAAGGLGYVAKRDLADELTRAIRSALRGERYESAAIGGR